MVMVMYKVNFVPKNEAGGGEGGERGLARPPLPGSYAFAPGCTYTYFALGFGLNEYLPFK